MTPEQALDQLRSLTNPEKATEMARYHKVDRPYLGVANPDIDTLCKEWRAAVDLDTRLTLASGLWDSNIHEARVAAAKLLTQARIRPDDSGAWDLIASWVPEFDMWTKRAALVMTLPWPKQNHPNPTDLAIRDRVLGWAASYTTDHDWFIQKAIAWWLRELSKHDAPRVRAFLDAHSDQMKPFAVKEAARKLPD